MSAKSLSSCKVAAACPACGGNLIEVRGHLQCSRCGVIADGCCEGGPQGRKPWQKRASWGPTSLAIQFFKSSLYKCALDASRLEEERKRVNTEPTDRQKDYGNYSKGHINVHGLRISIETPKGAKRRGTSSDGVQWENTSTHDYGYIRQTKASDGDHIDVYVGPNPSSELVVVIDQVDPSTGDFDEPKVMLGFDTVSEAKKGYLENYTKGWRGLGAAVPMTIYQFKDWLKGGTAKRPISTQTLKLKPA